jgi:hypothetical protein
MIPWVSTLVRDLGVDPFDRPIGWILLIDLACGSSWWTDPFGAYG